MPNRILRDWRDSEKVNALSVEAERFFTRLIMTVDDYGRYLADTRLLRTALFPLTVDKVTANAIDDWMFECREIGLLVTYEVKGKRYLQIEEFGQRLRIKRAKYPGAAGEIPAAASEGYVYVVGTSYRAPVKIGFSANPWARVKEIGIGHPEKLEVLITIRCDKKLETDIHACLAPMRYKNEWFDLAQPTAQVLIDCAAGKIANENLIATLRSSDEKLRSALKPKLKPKLKQETEEERKAAPDKVSVFRKKTVDNDIWVEQSCMAHKTDAPTLLEFCERWIAKAIPAQKFVDYGTGPIASFMLQDFEKEKSGGKKEKSKVSKINDSFKQFEL